jgi:hypothetical protein
MASSRDGRWTQRMRNWVWMAEMVEMDWCLLLDLPRGLLAGHDLGSC